MDPESDNEGQNQKNPVKRAEKEKEVREVGKKEDVITDPQALYETALRYNKTFKMVKNEHPKKKEFTIIDFSLNARGPDEDEIYVKQPFYRNNIRRGNTFIVDKNKKAHIARKGLTKFFDISQKSLYAIKNEDLMSLNKRDQYNHYAVFKEVENVLSCNDELEPKDKAKAHIYRLNKANGENAQVSFYEPLNEWVISSKNVSIFVKDANDIKLYKGERYGFSILIAEAWFNILKELPKPQLEALKKDLHGKTLVGEYCGNPEFQHLVKYANVTIFFYAVVENNGSATCIPPADAFRLFEQYHIPIVKNYERSYVGAFTEFAALGAKLIEVFQEVSTASIFEEEEGSVIYTVIEKPKVFCEYISDRYMQKTVAIPDNWETQDSWWHVSSLGKLKTLEYRILRKLREKLKFFTRIKSKEDTGENKEADFKKFQEKYGSFEKETYELLKNEKLSKPIEYYFCIALLAFEYTFKNRKSSKAIALLLDHYLDFLSVIFWCVENNHPVQEEYMRDEALHERLRGETWENYKTDIVAQYPEMLERIVPRYAKVKKTIKNTEQVKPEEGEDHGMEEEEDRGMEE